MKTYQKVLIAVGVLMIGGMVLLLHPDGSRLPTELPHDLVIEWQEGGGMNPEGSSAIMEAGQGMRDFTTMVDGQIVRSRVDFAPTDADMDALWRYMRQNSIDTIKTSDGQIYDGDNDRIRVSWGDEDISLWGLSVISSGQERFQKIYDLLEKYLNDRAPESSAVEITQ